MSSWQIIKAKVLYYWDHVGFLFGILALALVTLAVLYLLNANLQSRLEQNRVQRIDAAALVDLPSGDQPLEASSVAEVLAHFRRAIGREVDLSRIHTVHQRGTMRTARGETSIQAIRHINGDFFHLTLHIGGQPRSYRWSPESGLTLLDALGEEIPVDDQELAARFAYDAWPFNAPLAPSQRMPLVYVGLLPFLGREFHVLESAPSLPLPVRLYFDARTGLLRYREFPQTADGVVEIDEYLDYRLVDGIRLYHRLFLWRDGVYSGDQTISEITFNVGALR
ncbi:MAG: hypothetical protein JJT96_12805 [Opitutales bacterium]|nr:hypothetical protein [Opitutales bacterium]